MSNDRLRDAMHEQGVTSAELARDVGVDPKTVERWVTTQRVPYPKHRAAVANKLGDRQRYFWPSAVSDGASDEASKSELVQLYPHRNVVPADLWDRLLDQATTHVDVLVYVGMFLTEKLNLLATLRAKARCGARVRLLFGDRDSTAVIERSADEGIGSNTISAKIDHAVAQFKPLVGTAGIEMRTHGTVLYNSIYRFDDEMIVNPHVFGRVASHSPAMHLRRLSAGELFTTYADSFDAVWDSAESLRWEAS